MTNGWVMLIGDVKGPSELQKGGIDVDSINFAPINSSTGAFGGSSSGSVNYSAFSYSRPFDRFSNEIFMKVVSGETVPLVTFTHFASKDGKIRGISQLSLIQAIFHSFSATGGQHGTPQLETADLSFAKFDIVRLQ